MKNREYKYKIFYRIKKYDNKPLTHNTLFGYYHEAREYVSSNKRSATSFNIYLEITPITISLESATRKNTNPIAFSVDVGDFLRGELHCRELLFEWINDTPAISDQLTTLLRLC